MSSLTLDLISLKTKGKDLKSIKKLNCWASNLNDVSILNEIPNIEILTLSVNEINTLKDIQNCTNLIELYIRDNKIADLDEIYYLKNLKNLKILWLADNECVNSSDNKMYRLTVLRNLPYLHKLDNAVVTKEELDEALNSGKLIESPPKSKNNNTINNDTKQLTNSLFNSTIYSNEIKNFILPIKENDNKSIEEATSEETIKTELIASVNEETITITTSKIDHYLDEIKLVSMNSDLKSNETNNKSSNKYLDTIDELNLNDFNYSTTLEINSNDEDLDSMTLQLSFDPANNLKKESTTNNKEVTSQNTESPLKKTDSNVLSAVLILINELKDFELDKVIETCQQRKNSIQVVSFNN